MANRQEEIIAFSAEVNTSELDRIASQLDSYADALNGASTSSDGLDSSSESAGGSLSSMADFAIVAGGALGILTTASDLAMGAIGSLVGGLLEQQSALGLLQAQTGATSEEIAALGESGEDVFAAGWGESLGDVYNAMGQVRSVTGETGDVLEEVTTGALMLSEVFGNDVGQNARAVDALMDNFGVTATEALDIVTAGLQRTGGANSDLNDTLIEYSGNLSEMGFSGVQSINLLTQAMDAGAMNTDLAADALREFNIRLKDGTSAEAIQSLSEGSRDLFLAFQEGEATAASVFEMIIGDLNAMEDPIARNAAGVAIFGTKWEDMGDAALLALDPTSMALENVEGASERAGDAVQGSSGAWDRFTRTIQMSLFDALDPYVERLLNDLIPISQELSEWLMSDGVAAINSFADTLKMAGAALSTAFDIGGLQGVGQVLMDALGGGLGMLGQWAYDNIATPLVNSLISSETWQTAGQWLQTALNLGLSVMGDIQAWAVQNIGAPIVDFLSNPATWETANQWLQSALQAGINAVGDLAAWADVNLLQPLMGAFTGEGEGGGNSAASQWLNQLLTAGTAAIGDLGEWSLTNIIAPLGAALTNPENWYEAGQWLGELLKSGVNAGVDFGLWAFENIVVPLGNTLTNPETWIEVGNWLEGLFTTGMDTLESIQSFVFNDIITPIAGLLSNPETWQTARDSLVAFMAGFFDGLDINPQSAVNFINNAIVTPIKTAIGAASTDIYNTIADVINGAIPDSIDINIPSIDLGYGVSIGGGNFTLGPIPNPIPTRDMGGDGMAGQPYLIGRGAQPELFVPDTPGTFYPRGQYNLGGGGGQLQATIILPDFGVIYKGLVAYTQGVA